MLKLTRLFDKPLLKKKLSVSCRMVAASVNDINFDSEEEVIKNVIGEVMLIGLNLPNTRYLLTETALEKLCCYVEEFGKNEKFSAAVLHSICGSFCCGIVECRETLKLGECLLRKLNELNKPIIGSLNGYITNFGFYLAVMCDMRIMDLTGHAGLTDKNDLEIPLFAYERLLLTVGLSNALELVLYKNIWTAGKCLESCFNSKTVETGCALGASLLMAQSIAFHRPLGCIMRERAKIYSFLKSKC